MKRISMELEKQLVRKVKNAILSFDKRILRKTMYMDELSKVSEKAGDILRRFFWDNVDEQRTNIKYIVDVRYLSKEKVIVKCWSFNLRDGYFNEKLDLENRGLIDLFEKENRNLLTNEIIVRVMAVADYPARVYSESIILEENNE